MYYYEVRKLMKQGKKVRKRCWKIGDYLALDSNSYIVKGNIFNKDVGELPIQLSLDILNWLEDGIDDNWEILEDSLLTQEEKEYLKMIIKFVPGEIKSVTLGRYAGCYNYIYLNYSTDCGTCPNYCVSKKFFKNLESYRMYKLEELGLEE